MTSTWHRFGKDGTCRHVPAFRNLFHKKASAPWSAAAMGLPGRLRAETDIREHSQAGW